MKNRKEFQELNRMAYPILLHYLLTSLFEILDQAIVGHYSVRGVAVVGIAASVVYGVTGALGMLSSAFHIIAAEKIGKQDERGFENAFAGSKILVILIGLTVVLVSILFGKPFFYAVYRQQGKELQELLGYFYPASFTVLQNMLIFQYSVYFKNRQNTKITLWVTVVSTTVNLFFDFVLVYGAAGFPRLGTAGAAWGSILGLGCGLLVYQITYWKERQRRKTIRAEEIRGLIYRIWKIYPSLLGQELLESTIFVFMVLAAVARLGAEDVAVYKLLDLVCGMLELPVYAYAAATQTYALQNHAAGKKAAVRSYEKAGIQLSGMIVLSVGMLCGIFQKEVFHWILSDEMIIARAGDYLWMIVLLVLVKIPYRIRLLYLQGIGKEGQGFWITAAASVIFGVGAFAAAELLQLSGIYLMIILEYGLLGGIYRWQSKKV